MKSIINQLSSEADELIVLITKLIRVHSLIKRWKNSRHDQIFILAGDYCWEELPQEGKQLQTRILKEYGKYSALIRMLVQSLPSQVAKELEKSLKSVLDIVEQTQHLWSESKEEQLESVVASLRGQIRILEGIYDPLPDETIVVPDTNALLSNPHIETWSFRDLDHFTLVMIPAVLRELDELKVHGKREELRDKAKTLVRKTKEYLRRGDVFEGVKLAGNNKISFIAVEPKPQTMLPWLDPENVDDRIIASYFEVVIEHPRSQVILVTGDVNLQNKATYAGVIVDDPPEAD